MTLVLDGSAALAWCFEDESSPAIDAVMLRVADEGAAVPALWRIEVANALQMAVRRKRITDAYRDAALSRLQVLDIRVDAESDVHVWPAALPLAARHGLTVYDACYLELAQRRRLPLATLDTALADAARQSGVEVLPNG